MTNKSGNIGAKTETWACRAFNRLGFPYAERRRPEGEQDRADIAGMIGVAVQVKGGHAAEDASLEQIRTWLEDTERQRRVARADVGILICKRKAVGYANAHQWWCYFTEDTYRAMLGQSGKGHRTIIMRVTLEDVAFLLRLNGWGEPLPVDGNGKITVTELAS